MTDEGNITDAEVEAAREAFEAVTGEVTSKLALRAALLAAFRVRPAGGPVAPSIGLVLLKEDTEPRATFYGHEISKLPAGEHSLYASPAPSYADAIRDAAKAVNDFVGWGQNWRREIVAVIESLTPAEGANPRANHDQ